MSEAGTLARRIALAHELRRQWIDRHGNRPPEHWLGDQLDALCPLDISGRKGGANRDPGSLVQRVHRIALSLGGIVAADDVLEALNLPERDRQRVNVALSKLRCSGRLPALGETFKARVYQIAEQLGPDATLDSVQQSLGLITADDRKRVSSALSRLRTSGRLPRAQSA